MYVPASFKMTERADVLALMKANPFAALISQDSGGLAATHLLTVTRQVGEAIVIGGQVALELRDRAWWGRS